MSNYKFYFINLCLVRQSNYHYGIFGKNTKGKSKALNTIPIVSPNASLVENAKLNCLH